MVFKTQVSIGKFATVADLAEAAGLSASQCYRVLQGGTRKIELAVKLHRLTDGAASAYRLLRKSGIPDKVLKTILEGAKL